MNAGKPVPGQTSTDESQLGRRDAFHAPCVMVKSKQWLGSCDPVRFIASAEVELWEKADWQAVVDPWLISFLDDAPQGRDLPPGTLFWVFVNHKLVGDLTHRFEIEGVPATEAVEANLVPEQTALEEEEEAYEYCDYSEC